MVEAKLETFFSILVDYGWHLEKREASLVQLGDTVRVRYPKLPKEYIDFLERVKLCTSADETVWFLTEEDYTGKGEAAFSWNEFELMSLDAAAGDEDLIRSITSFWQQHIPIMFSLKSGYSFLAISLFSQSYGEIFTGREPEFEDVSKVCSSFDQLLELLQEAIGNEDNQLLNRLL